MRKCCLMFGILIIVLVLASKIEIEEKKLNSNYTVALDVQIKRP